MSFVIRAVHFLALGLWLGGVVFFSFFTALPVISGMQALATRPDNWLGLHTKEEGTRLAGEFLTVTFARYFPYQVGLGLVALVTALLWPRIPGKVHKFRVTILAIALLLALANMLYFSPKVGTLRQARYGSDATLAAQANQEFGRWHNYSLGSDMLGLVLVGLALTLVSYHPYQPSAPGDK